ncbi:hypothetical protein BDR04DRAFT_1099562 [Suillus decipiens]|nr:hypothetical protein BDR04DRAFT_1099562 [Suillus decipiens]
MALGWGSSCKICQESKAVLPMQRPIAGGQANEKDWWENLPMSAKTYPLKSPLFSIVPHAADVEQLFGGIQSRALAAGQPVRRKHARMHTWNNDGIDMDLAMDLDTNLAWTPLLVSQNDVQQVGFDLKDNISWDVLSLLTMKGVSSM